MKVYVVFSLWIFIWWNSVFVGLLPTCVWTWWCTSWFPCWCVFDRFLDRTKTWTIAFPWALFHSDISTFLDKITLHDENLWSLHIFDLPSQPQKELWEEEKDTVLHVLSLIVSQPSSCLLVLSVTEWGWCRVLLTFTWCHVITLLSQVPQTAAKESECVPHCSVVCSWCT